jgi:hypothetical protein
LKLTFSFNWETVNDALSTSWTLGAHGRQK